EFRVQVQALARFYRHFFLAFAWHNVAPWPSVYASHTKVRIGSGAVVITNDNGRHFRRARENGHHVYSWAELIDADNAPSAIANRLGTLLGK
ncbi:hypothetical protein KTD05_27780, partial [Burkholderia multivorans]|nr:hypothetical protein [Burkholderia multivorans]